MTKQTNASQDSDSRRPKPGEDLEPGESTSGTPRGGGQVEVPGSSGDTGTIKVKG